MNMWQQRGTSIAGHDDKQAAATTKRSPARANVYVFVKRVATTAATEGQWHGVAQTKPDLVCERAHQVTPSHDEVQLRRTVAPVRKIERRIVPVAMGCWGLQC